MLSGLLVVVVLLLALAIPGWALLAVSGAFRDWKPLQRWCLALGLGAAFYPVLFYAASLLPGALLGRWQIVALLATCLIAVLWFRRQNWRAELRLERSDWIPLVLIGATLFTRYWVLGDNPYPAWSDSLHHVLLTQLTASGGRLPSDMLPYAPAPLVMYHLGLYGLAAVAQWLSGAPSHTALLWTAQTLNGLSGLGVFLVLDRKVSRAAALVGLVTVGLLSHQPAFYVNWGRFTQVSSQTLLLIAFLVTWETVTLWTRGGAGSTRIKTGAVALSAVLNAGVFLLHFRVAAFYLALVGLVLVWELVHAAKHGRLRGFLTAALAIAAASLVLVLPAVIPALTAYVSRARTEPATVGPDYAAIQAAYHAISWSSVPALVARPWLLVVAGIAAVVVIVRRNLTGLLALEWMLLLAAIGSAHLLGIAFLDLTNLSGVLIMFYLPLALIVGAAAQECLGLAPAARRRVAEVALLSLCLLSGLVFSRARVADLEPYRFFVAPDDVKAMTWIDQNTPPGARFAVNTSFWLADSPHGTDAGYWIPYFTGRETTASNMLFALADGAYRDKVLTLSHAADELDLQSLRRLGVRYVYSGVLGDFSDTGLSREVLSKTDGLKLLFESGGASVWEITERSSGA